ncbi:MucR family transcriptional regulator [Sphingomonas mucosissima]|uniref:Transcriptional regulatory protein ros n=1 Tax=Sphingomonas mucosissima TaxID=370959 RepID=A0A245ZFT0_9SPHN|nr:MucR family transcriptional regulator [Sphingomonas mucosissima]OWK28602.1 transcriptional regulatory protein ros [Sphingomonas mucosissima]
MKNENNNQVELATDLTVAWLSNPNTRAAVDDIPAFLRAVHDALGALVTPAAQTGDQEATVEYKPAVSVRKSLADPEYIVSMIDGKKYRSLTRHLNANGLSPADYRERYGLKPDYPLVAPAYSAERRAIAKQLGLGRKKGQKVEKEVAAVTATRKPAPKKRKSAADAKEAAKAHLGGIE